MKTKLLLLLTLIFLGVNTNAQDDYKATSKLKDWGFTITPYAMLASQSTNVDNKKIRQSFGDLSTATNAGFQLVTTVRYKRVFLSLDGTWATLGGDLDQARLDVNVKIKQQILDFKAGYFVYENFSFEDNNTIRGWALGFNVGAKYWSNIVTVNYKLQADNPIFDDPIIIGDETKIPQDWWDLMLGVETRFILNPKVLLGVSFDIGGFGIGESSKLSYNFTYVNNFKVLKWMSVDAGFRYYSYKRVDGQGADEVNTKVNVIGPLLGVSFTL